LRNEHLIDNFQSSRTTIRKRSRTIAARPRPGRAGSPSRTVSGQPGDDGGAGKSSREVLVLVESEGAVFDTLALRHEKAYLPTFVEYFAWGIDPLLCGHLWRSLALSSRLRGQDPSLILLYALRLLNRHAPSIRRAAVIRALDSFLSGQSRDPMQLASAHEGSPERLILSWITASEKLVASTGYAASFPSAATFLRMVKEIAPNAAILVYSSFPESLALNQWEVSGMGDCFLRIAGAERGDFPEYVRMALRNGYDQKPLLVIGTTYPAWLAAQTAGARLYPIVPFKEEESWKFLAETYFPAFLKGQAAFVDRDERDFVRMMFDDLDAGFRKSDPWLETSAQG